MIHLLFDFGRNNWFLKVQRPMFVFTIAYSATRLIYRHKLKWISLDFLMTIKEI